MLAIFGTALVIAALLLFAWAVLGFRNPAGGAWRERYLVLESISCLIVGVFVFGLAMQIKFALEFAGPAGWLLCAAALGFAPLAYLAIWRWLGVRAKLAEYDRVTAETAPAVLPRRARKAA